MVLYVSLNAKVVNMRVNSEHPKPQPDDHFAQLEKRLYDLTNQRFGGTIK